MSKSTLKGFRDILRLIIGLQAILLGVFFMGFVAFVPGMSNEEQVKGYAAIIAIPIFIIASLYLMRSLKDASDQFQLVDIAGLMFAAPIIVYKIASA